MPLNVYRFWVVGGRFGFGFLDFLFLFLPELFRVPVCFFCAFPFRFVLYRSGGERVVVRARFLFHCRYLVIFSSLMFDLEPSRAIGGAAYSKNFLSS